MNYNFANLKDLEKKYIFEILDWRNRDHVRKMMISKDIIAKNDHEKYISKVLNESDQNIYIGFLDNRPFGVVNTWTKDIRNYEYGYYLIHEEDIQTGLGILMEYFVINTIFNIEAAEYIFTNTYCYNKKTINLHKRFGFEYLEENNELVLQRLNRDKWMNRREEIKKLVEFILL